MLQAYSLNTTVAADTAIPFNTIRLEKGCTARLVSPTTVQLNKAGVYCIKVNASIEPTAVGDVSIQLSKDGVLLPDAQSIATGAVGDLESLSFDTLVQVPTNNSCACYVSPTTLQVINGPAATYDNITISVTKVC